MAVLAQAAKWISEGMAVRRIGWADLSCGIFVSGSDNSNSILFSNGFKIEAARFRLDDFIATDWVICEQPDQRLLASAAILTEDELAEEAGISPMSVW